MNKRISLGAAIAFMLIVATATFAMTMIYATNNFNQKVVDLKEREALIEKFSDIDRQVRQKYYGTIDETGLMDNVARGYIRGLGDPYASYISAVDYDRILRQQEGQIAGIGAVLEANVEGDGFLVVKQVYPNSPALAAGLQENDLIIKIDDNDLTPENSAWMLESVQGEAGTRISITVRRRTDDSTEELPAMEMTRRQVAVPVVHGSMIEDTNIGYIWIESFDRNTLEQFNRELGLLSGADAIIFDVRDNSGGLLETATSVLERLLPPGRIASYQRRDGEREEYNSVGQIQFDKPIAVIVNGNTESAAELFALALRDYDRARLVGTTTFGKNVVQELFQLNDGSAVQITIAELIGPTGEAMPAEGIRPDYEVSLSSEEGWRNLELAYDTQLTKALEVAQGMVRTGTSVDETSEPETSEPEESSQLEETSQDESSAESGDTSEEEDETSHEEDPEESADESSEDESSEDD